MLIFLDTQTTGLESTDKIISIAVMTILEDETISKYDLVNEGKKIPSLASSINHITNEMIKDKVKLKESETYKFLVENNNDENILIGHNIKFDLEKLNSIGFFWEGKIIDTMRVTKHLIPECEFFSLQFLRYELRIYKKEQVAISAHNSQSDVIVIKNLYDYLKEMVVDSKMIELSSKKVLLEKLNFGKYSGRYIEDIVMSDRGYLEWLLGSATDLDDDLRYSVEYYMC